jgi:putative membrane protein
MMGWHVGDHMSGWGWVGMTLSTVLFVGLLVLGGLLLVRTARPQEPPTPSSPELLLAERFARGEIDEEEYRRRLATLAETRTLSR